MSKLKVEIDYIKLAQYVENCEYYLRLLKNELDKAVVERKNDGEFTSNNSLLKIDFSSNL